MIKIVKRMREKMMMYRSVKRGRNKTRRSSIRGRKGRIKRRKMRKN